MSETLHTDSRTFLFELVSPEARLVSGPAFQVDIPGEDGDFGVRSGHMSLLASVRPGVLSIVGEPGEDPRKIFVAGGFADVTQDRCLVLAEEAIPVSEMDAQALEQKVRDLTEDLALVEDAQDRTRIERDLVLAKARFQAASA